VVVQPVGVVHGTPLTVLVTVPVAVASTVAVYCTV